MGEEGGGALCQVKEGCLSLREEEGGLNMYTCMFSYLGIDTCSYFDIERYCRPYGCP